MVWQEFQTVFIFMQQVILVGKFQSAVYQVCHDNIELKYNTKRKQELEMCSKDTDAQTTGCADRRTKLASITHEWNHGEEQCYLNVVCHFMAGV